MMDFNIYLAISIFQFLALVATIWGLFRIHKQYMENFGAHFCGQINRVIIDIKNEVGENMREVVNLMLADHVKHNTNIKLSQVDVDVDKKTVTGIIDNNLQK